MTGELRVTERASLDLSCLGCGQIGTPSTIDARSGVYLCAERCVPAIDAALAAVERADEGDERLRDVVPMEWVKSTIERNVRLAYDNGYRAGHRDGLDCEANGFGGRLDECEHVGRIAWSETPEATMRPAALAASSETGSGLDAPAPDAAPPDAIDLFVAQAGADMARRMRDGERRGWGSSWQYDYPDTRVRGRLARAKAHLLAALHNYRAGSVGVDEVRKRAADVANQAFMLADPERLANRARRNPR